MPAGIVEIHLVDLCSHAVGNERFSAFIKAEPVLVPVTLDNTSCRVDKDHIRHSGAIRIIIERAYDPGRHLVEDIAEIGLLSALCKAKMSDPDLPGGSDGEACFLGFVVRENGRKAAIEFQNGAGHGLCLT